jgi:hypothetical protein
LKCRALRLAHRRRICGVNGGPCDRLSIRHLYITVTRTVAYFSFATNLAFFSSFYNGNLVNSITSLRASIPKYGRLCFQTRNAHPIAQVTRGISSRQGTDAVSRRMIGIPGTFKTSDESSWVHFTGQKSPTLIAAVSIHAPFTAHALQ